MIGSSLLEPVCQEESTYYGILISQAFAKIPLISIISKAFPSLLKCWPGKGSTVTFKLNEILTRLPMLRLMLQHKKHGEKSPCREKRAEELTKIVQGPDEPFQDFLSRLLQAAGRILGESDAG